MIPLTARKGLIRFPEYVPIESRTVSDVHQAPRPDPLPIWTFRPPSTTSLGAGPARRVRRSASSITSNTFKPEVTARAISSARVSIKIDEREVS